MKPNITYFDSNTVVQNNKRRTFVASTMFVDIKGFTPLTEKLLLFGTEGAEVLSEILDEIFAPMVAIVVEKKGIIPHFAGDAFTAIFIDDKGEAVLDVAWRIKQHFDNKELFNTHFGDFDIPASTTSPVRHFSRKP